MRIGAWPRDCHRQLRDLSPDRNTAFVRPLDAPFYFFASSEEASPPGVRSSACLSFAPFSVSVDPRVEKALSLCPSGHVRVEAGRPPHVPCGGRVPRTHSCLGKHAGTAGRAGGRRVRGAVPWFHCRWLQGQRRVGSPMNPGDVTDSRRHGVCRLGRFDGAGGPSPCTPLILPFA